LIFAKARDRDGLHRLATAISQQLASVQDAMEVNNLTWFLALCRESADRYEGPVVQMEASLPAVSPRGRHLFLNTLGALLYRAGRHQGAIDRLMEGIKARSGREVPQDWAFLAMAAHKLGRREEALRWMKKLREWRGVPSEKAFWDNLEIEVLRDEAEEILP
jgi:tetratricopeptide (TPR) repeat protein